MRHTNPVLQGRKIRSNADSTYYQYNVFPITYFPISTVPVYSRSNFGNGMPSNRRHYFLYNNNIILNFKTGQKDSKQKHDIRGNCVVYHMIGRDHRGVHNSLNKTYKKHNHRLSYFFARYVSLPPSTFVQIQKSIIAGLESCGGVIPYP